MELLGHLERFLTMCVLVDYGQQSHQIFGRVPQWKNAVSEFAHETH